MNNHISTSCSRKTMSHPRRRVSLLFVIFLGIVVMTLVDCWTHNLHSRWCSWLKELPTSTNNYIKWWGWIYLCGCILYVSKLFKNVNVWFNIARFRKIWWRQYELWSSPKNHGQRSSHIHDKKLTKIRLAVDMFPGGLKM